MGRNNQEGEAPALFRCSPPRSISETGVIFKDTEEKELAVEEGPNGAGEG